MSRFTGKQYPGALKDLRAQRKLEAEQHNITHQALNPSGVQDSFLPPVRKGWALFSATATAPTARGAATRLLNAIFGNPIDREAQP